MEIKNISQTHFRFEFSEYEKNSPAGRRFIENLKSSIPHGERYWIREANAWAIRKSKITQFNKILNLYTTELISTNQEEIPFYG